MPSSASAESTIKAIAADPTKVLGLTVGSHEIKPGDQIPKADTKDTPKLSLPNAAAGKQYVVVGIDLDAPFPSMPVLGPILHWCQAGLVSNGDALEPKDTPVIAFWAAANPPPMSGPHRYVVCLYEQPVDFDNKKYAPADGKAIPITQRMRYSLEDFEKEAKLGPVIAANYFNSK